MTGPKTNEREGTKAMLRNSPQSAWKVRAVLDLIRGLDVQRAREVLEFCERDAATTVGKLLDSAIANAEHNDQLNGEELFVSACFADEARTQKRLKPRARGRAGRIFKRSCHITVIVSRLPEDKLARLKAREEATATERRARRVAGSGRRARVAASKASAGSAPVDETAVEEIPGLPDAEVIEAAEVAAEETEAATVEAEADAPVAEVVDEAPAEEAPADAAPADAAPADDGTGRRSTGRRSTAEEVTAADETPADAGDEEKSE